MQIHIDIETELVLLPELAAWLPASQTLILGDLHVGRVQHMRKNGLPVPAASAQKEPELWIQMLEKHQPKICIILGDLFHSQPNAEWEQLWQELAPFDSLQFVWVLGNHDRYAQQTAPHHWQVLDQWQQDGIRFCHEPSQEEGFEICGHLHPKIQIQGKGRQRLSLPCFWLQENRMILPAFSRLAGGHAIQAQKSERVFVSDGKRVREWKAQS